MEITYKWSSLVDAKSFFSIKPGGDLMYKMSEVARFGGFENWLVSIPSRNSIYNVQQTAFAIFSITDMHKNAVLISPQL